MLKYLYIVSFILFIGCAHNYDVIRVNEQESFMIENWKSNGIKIIDIDTVKTSKGIEYVVKVK